MFVSEITDFLYAQVKKPQQNGEFTDEHTKILNSMIDEIGKFVNVVGITMRITDFYEQYEKFGGDMEQMKKDWEAHKRKNPRFRVMERLGKAVIRSGRDVKETADRIKRRYNIPLNEKLREVS